MTRRLEGGKDYCFRCGEYAVGTLDSRPGDASFPWRRRKRQCRACGCRWSTLEILAPDDPLAAEIREAKMVAAAEADVGFNLTFCDLIPLRWQEARTCR